ncbi:MAG: HEAT repeat domain-containing protein [Desulfobacteraceae bacterium]|nr:HEAT repeat domain-containing protein [Desulfobacteraceae bacterium]
MLKTGEDIQAAKNVIQALVRARKNMMIYPSNNPIYKKTIQNNFEKFNQFFEHSRKLIFQIRRFEIFYQNERVYHNTSKNADNLSLIFFKDGIHELSFKSKMPYEELKTFLEVISLDFEKDVIDDDIVTLLWENDFGHIRYIVDDEFLTDEGYQTQAVAQIQKHLTDPDAFQEVYSYEIRLDDKLEALPIVEITDMESQLLLRELEDDADNKTDKLIKILFELLYAAKTKEKFSDLEIFFKNTIEYALKHQDIESVNNILARLNTILKKGKINEEIRQHIQNIIQFIGKKEIIDLIGEQLDDTKVTKVRPYRILIEYFEKDAIPPLMYLLNKLKTIHARRLIIDGLVFLGPKDMLPLIKGLDHKEWYVVRNAVYILRKIGDKSALDPIRKKAGHPDIQVKKEVIMALGELGDENVLQVFEEYLENPEFQVRITTLKALAYMSSEKARKILVDRISGSDFKNKNFNEKIGYFESLSHWKDKQTSDFMIHALKPKGGWTGSKDYEIRACAAYGLGLMKDEQSLKYLYKNQNSKNILLKEYANQAIKRTTHGK